MSKLMEWLCAISLFLSIWAALVTKTIDNNITEQYMHLIKPAPLISIIIFGVYAVFIVLYRVFTFNNCETAATELKKEIQLAKDDLKKKGFIFNVHTSI